MGDEFYEYGLDPSLMYKDENYVNTNSKNNKNTKTSLSWKKN